MTLDELTKKLASPEGAKELRDNAVASTAPAFKAPRAAKTSTKTALTPSTSSLPTLKLATGLPGTGNAQTAKSTAAKTKTVPTIKALGASDYGAGKDHVVKAGAYSTASSLANIRGQLLAPTGDLTMGQSAQAAIKGVSQSSAEKEKYNRQAVTQKKAYGAADSLAQRSAEEVAKAKAGKGKFGQTMVDVGVAGTQMLGDLAMNAIMPGSGLAAMGARAYGSSSLEARQAGANALQQVGYGLASAGVEMLTEKLFDGLAGLYGGGAFDKTIEKAIGKMAKSDAGKTALRVLANAGSEGIEEITSDVVNPIIRSIYNNKSVGQNYSEEKLSDWLHDGLVGGILGAGGGGFGQATNYAAGKSKAALAKGADAVAVQVIDRLNGNALSVEQADVITTALTFGEGSKTRELAQSLASKLDGAGSGEVANIVSNKELGKLYRLMQTEATEYAPKADTAEEQAQQTATMNPGKTVMSPTAMAFRAAGEKADTAVAKAEVLDKLLATGGVTAEQGGVSNKQLSDVLKTADDTTRAVIEQVTGQPLGRTTTAAEVRKAFRSAAAQYKAQQEEAAAKAADIKATAAAFTAKRARVKQSADEQAAGVMSKAVAAAEGQRASQTVTLPDGQTLSHAEFVARAQRYARDKGVAIPSADVEMLWQNALTAAAESGNISKNNEGGASDGRTGNQMRVSNGRGGSLHDPDSVRQVAGGQGKGNPGGKGSQAGGDERTGGQVREKLDGKTPQKMSSIDLGLGQKYGTDDKTFTVVPAEDYTEQEQAISEQNKKAGVKTVILDGPLFVRSSGRRVKADGLHSLAGLRGSGSTIVLSRDASKDINVVNDHELCHVAIATHPGLYKAIDSALDSRLTENERSWVRKYYEKAYGAEYIAEGGRPFEEYFCDLAAGDDSAPFVNDELVDMVHEVLANAGITYASGADVAPSYKLSDEELPDNKRDSFGRALARHMSTYMQDSVARVGLTTNGRLLVLYRGMSAGHAAAKDVTWWTTRPDIARTYSHTNPATKMTSIGKRIDKLEREYKSAHDPDTRAGIGAELKQLHSEIEQYSKDIIRPTKDPDSLQAPKPKNLETAEKWLKNAGYKIEASTTDYRVTYENGGLFYSGTPGPSLEDDVRRLAQNVVGGGAYSSGAIYEAFAKLTHPYILHCEGHIYSDLPANDSGHMLTDYVVDWARKQRLADGTPRYDGVVFDNVVDSMVPGQVAGDSTSTVVVTFHSNQAKSTQNTNPTEDDRFAYKLSDEELPDDKRDNFGKALLPGMAEYMQDSIMRDGLTTDGRLLVMYRGARSGHAAVGKSAWWSNRPEIARTYSMTSSGTRMTYLGKQISKMEGSYAAERNPARKNSIGQQLITLHRQVEQLAKDIVSPTKDPKSSHIRFDTLAEAEKFLKGDGYKLELNENLMRVLGRDGDEMLSVDLTQVSQEEATQQVCDKAAEIAGDPIDPEESYDAHVIYAGYLRMTHPFVIDCKGKDYEHLPSNESGEDITDFVVQWARQERNKDGSLKYDGVIFDNIIDSADPSDPDLLGGDLTGIVAYTFDNSQAKSLTNENPTGDERMAFKVSEVDEQVTLNAAQRWSAKLIKAALKNTPLENVVFTSDMPSGADAFVQGDTVYLNAKTMTSQRAITWTLGHELVHPAADADVSLADDIISAFQDVAKTMDGQTGPAMRERYVDDFEGYTERRTRQYHDFLMGQDGVTKEQVDALLKDGSYIREEIAADWMRDAFYDQNLLNRMAGRRPELIAQALKLLDGLRGTAPSSAYDKVMSSVTRRLSDSLSIAAQMPEALENVRFSITTDTPWAEQVAKAVATEDLWRENSRKTGKDRDPVVATALYIGETPNLLAEVGLGDLPMCYTKLHLYDALAPEVLNDKGEPIGGTHGLSVEIMKSLPELLSKPAMILAADPATHNGDIVVVTTKVLGDGRPVIVAIHPNGRATVDGVSGPANFILSVYPRNHFTAFINAVDRNNGYLYVNEKRSRDVLQKAGVSSPKQFEGLDFDAIIKPFNGYAKGGTPARRFSLSSDAFGRDLSDDQQSYFRDSVMRTGNTTEGALRPFYHGTRQAFFSVFDPGLNAAIGGFGTFFTSDPEVAEAYTQPGQKDSAEPGADDDGQLRRMERIADLEDDRASYASERDLLLVDLHDAAEDGDTAGVDELTEKIGKIRSQIKACDTLIEMYQKAYDHFAAVQPRATALEKQVKDISDKVVQANLAFRRLQGDIMDAKWEGDKELETDLTLKLEKTRAEIRKLQAEKKEKSAAAMKALQREKKSDAENAKIAANAGFITRPTKTPGAVSGDDLHEIEDAPGVYEVYLNLTHPLVIDCQGRHWDSLGDLSKYGSATDFIAAAAHEDPDADYDGVVFLNVVDGNATVADEAIIFKSEQAKSTANLHPTTDPDLRFKIADSKGELDKITGKDYTKTLQNEEGLSNGYETESSDNRGRQDAGRIDSREHALDHTGGRSPGERGAGRGNLGGYKGQGLVSPSDYQSFSTALGGLDKNTGKDYDTTLQNEEGLNNGLRTESSDNRGRQDAGRADSRRQALDAFSKRGPGERRDGRGNLGGYKGLVSPSDYQSFSAALGEARAANKFGQMVDPQSVEDLTASEARAFLSPDSTMGVAVEGDGNIVGVFKNPSNPRKQVVRALLFQALDNGGDHLDCYMTPTGSNLVRKYTALGFEPVAWLQFNREYAPEGWDYEVNGDPDVVMMVHNGDSIDAIERNTLNYKTWSPDDVHALPEFTDYDEAKAYQMEQLNKIKTAQESKDAGAVSASTPRYSLANTDMFDAYFETLYRNQGYKPQVAARQAGRPAKTATSQVGANTFHKSNVFTDAEKHMKGLKKGSFDYNIKTEQVSMREALTRLTNNYAGEKAALPSAKGWSGTDLDTAMGILGGELRAARATGNYDAVRNWAKIVQQKGTQAGQMIQAFAKYSRTPEGILVRAAEDLEKTNLPKAKKDQLMQRIAAFAKTLETMQAGDKNGLIDLILQQAKMRNTPVSKKTLTNLRLQKFNWLYDVAMNQMDQLAKDYMKVGAGKKISTYQIMSHLLNFRTANRNLVSNQVFDEIDGLLAGNMANMADMFMGVFTGQRGVGWQTGWLGNSAVSKAKRAGAVDGLHKAWIEIALDVAPDDATQRDKYGTARRTWKMTGNKGAQRMSSSEKVLGFELNATDEFHKGSVAAQVTQSLADCVAKGYMTQDEAEQCARDEALYRSFQDDTKIGALLGGIHDLGNMLVGTGDSGKRLAGHVVHDFGLGDFIQRYTRVPGALLTRAIEFSPLGYFKLINNLAVLGRACKDARASGQKFSPESVMAQRKAALAFGRATTGSGLITAFAALAAAGLLKRQDDKDDPDAAALAASEGIGGTQLNVTALNRVIEGGSAEWRKGDVLVSIDFLEPLNSLMAMGAQVASDKSAEGLWEKSLAFGKDSIQALYDSLGDLPTMQTVKTVQDTKKYHSDDSKLPLWMEIPVEVGKSALTGFVPSLVRQGAQATDSAYRDAYGTNDTLAQVWASLKNTIPGARETLPKKLTNFGVVKKQESQPMNALNSFFNPGDIRTYQQSEVSKELSKVFKASGNANIYPDRNAPYKIQATIDGNDVTYKASEAQRRTYQKTRGKTSYTLMQDVMAAQSYADATSVEKSEILQKTKNYANYLAKQEFFASKNQAYSDTEYERITEALDTGMNVADYWTMSKTLTALKDTAGDRDENGKAKSGTVKRDLMAAINGYDLTPEQKDILYYNAGYKESTIDETPWH